MAESSTQEEAIFHAALEIDAADQRAAYLAAACGNQPGLRQRVEALLRRHAEVEGPLDRPDINRLATAETPIGESPGTAIGPYKLLEQIGEGGFGVVFMAEQQQPVRRKVALKVLKPGMDTKQVVARFEAERQALAIMDHPHIARVLDAGTTDTGRPYFVMELIRGIPITQFCDDNRLTPRERLELFVTVCQAVQHAHQKGIIHRDLKPSNVLVTLQDGAPVVKVIDFGIAKALGQERLTEKTLFTGFAQMIGTPLYMSPEQADMSGQDVDTRSDIYSLGVLLYELLTGTTPLDKERLKEVSYDEIRRIIREEEPAKPSTRISTLRQAASTVSANRKSEPRRLSQLFRRELDWIVMKALEKDRNRRYDTASSFAADVQRYLDDEPVQACPPTAGYWLRKFARKYWMPLIVAAGFILLLVAGVVVSAWQAVRATAAEGVASTRRLEAEAARVRASTAEAKAKEEAERARRQSYAAGVRLMQQAWDSHNMSELRRLLDETAAFPERGFEWYYWQRLSHVEHLTLMGHTGGVTAVAFTPDGQRLATGGRDGTARIWNATSGEELLCLRGHHGQVTAVAFAPAGQWLVTGSTDGAARFWDVSTGHPLRTLQGPNSGPVWAVAVTPDGQRVATGSEDGNARLWDVATGKELVTLDGNTALPAIGASTIGLLSSPGTPNSILAASALYPGKKGHRGPVWAVAVTPDGKRLVTTGADNMVLLWDATTGRQLRNFLGNYFWVDWGINSVAVTPDGKRLITAGNDNTARVWDTETGTELLTLSVGTGWILSVAVTPDGQRFITAHSIGAAKMWEMAARPDILASTVGLLSSPQAAGAILAAPALSPQKMRGREILTLLDDRNLTCIAVSPEGTRLATASSDGTARVWDLAGRRGSRTLSGHTAEVQSIAVTSDGQQIVTGSFDGTAKVWDTASGRILRTLKGHTDAIWRVAVTRDGQRIITGSADGTARVWDALSGEELHKIEVPKKNGRSELVRAIALTPDGKQLVTGSWEVAQLWDVASGQLLRTFTGPSGIISRLAVTPDGQHLVMACWNDGTTRLWDINSGQEVLKLPESASGVASVAVTPHGQRLITGRGDGTATVWDIASRRELFSLNGHTDLVTSIVVTPDEQRIATASVDGTVRLWDAQSGREFLTLNPHTGPIWSVAVTPDGQRLVTGSADGTVRIWEAASPEHTTVWAREDQEAERRRAAWQRPGPQAHGFIQDWLVLGPLALTDDETGAKGLERRQLPEEASLHPRAGDHASVSGQELTWQERHWDEPVLDFNRFLKKLSGDRLAYAVCYVTSAAERPDLLLQVGSDGHAKVYLNGQAVYECTRGGALDPVGPITLHRGTNVLVLKMVNVGGGWIACARFVDRQSYPIEGLQVRLTPE